jgi:ABC-type branched-subunit amino acid transport system ATPase component
LPAPGSFAPSRTVRLFDGLTTLENVAVAALAAGGTRRRDSHAYARASASNGSDCPRTACGRA